MKELQKTSTQKIRYKITSLLVCLSFILSMTAGIMLSYNYGTYSVYAFDDYDIEMETFGTYATTSEREYFMNTMVPLVIDDMVENRVLASLTLAQAALETGWGISAIARASNNMFGIRAYSTWSGKVYNSTTKKIYENYEEGSKESGKLWRAYDSWGDSVKDHSNLINNSDIYKKVRGNFDYRSAATEIVLAGYTSNMSYIDEVVYVIERYEFYKYDEQALAIMGKTNVGASQTTMTDTKPTDTTDTEPTKGFNDYIPTEKSEFIETIGKLANDDMKSNEILASFTIAQAIYHSNWGNSAVTKKTYNLFGIMATSSWGGKVYNSSTGIVYDSYADASKKSGSLWRAYDSIEESIADRSAMFRKSSRYKNLVANYDYKSCCKLVVEDGYINSATYADTLISYIEEYNLTRFDAINSSTSTLIPTQTTESTQITETTSQYDPLSQYDTKNNGRLYGVKCATNCDSFVSTLAASGKIVSVTNTTSSFIGTGSILTDEAGKKYMFVISGDVDGDGIITASDYILIKRHHLGLTTFYGALFDAADYDSNGKIDSTDYINIKRVLLNIK